MKRSFAACILQLALCGCALNAVAQTPPSTGSAAPALGQRLTTAQGAAVSRLIQNVPGAAAGWSTMQERTAQGVQVMRYLDASGRVFAVTWKGPVKPALADVLGTYFGQSTAASKPALHTATANDSGDLVFVSQGALGHLWGKAYLKSLLPQGFDLQTLN